MLEGVCVFIFQDTFIAEDLYTEGYTAKTGHVHIDKLCTSVDYFFKCIHSVFFIRLKLQQQRNCASAGSQLEVEDWVAELTFQLISVEKNEKDRIWQYNKPEHFRTENPVTLFFPPQRFSVALLTCVKKFMSSRGNHCVNL